MQDAVPLPVELGLAQDRFPGLPHDVVAGTILAPDHQPQHFDGGSSAEQREDQRLDDAERASNRARVSPRFEVVRAGICATPPWTDVSSTVCPSAIE